MKDAAAAKTALQGMADAAKAEGAAEVAAAAAAAAARAKDTAAIREEAQALQQLGNAAKQTNVQLLYGGRNDETQHLADMAQELNYTTLLNRQKWLGFSSVQQAMSYRQQMYQLALLENKAHFAGYLTADQYLGFLQRETMQTAALSAAIRDRTAVIAAETTALLGHANALQGTHQSAGQLGEQLGAASIYAAALGGIQPLVRTRAEFDDSQALAEIAAYRAALHDMPLLSSVSARIEGALPGGLGAPVVAQITPRWSPDVLAQLTAADQEARLLAAEMAELNRRSLAISGQPFEQIEAARAEAEALDAELEIIDAEVVEPHLAIEGADEAEIDLEAIRAMLDAIPDDTTKVINVDGVGAVEEMEAFTRAFEDIPRAAEVQAEFDDKAAEAGLDGFVGDLVAAIREKYAFYAEFDDEEALAKAQNLEAWLRELTGEGEKLSAGMGGASGGGGGGGPPIPPAGPPEPPDGGDDAAYWESIFGAMRAADDEAVRSATTSKAAGAAAVAAGGAARGAGGWWGFWGRQLTLFGGAFNGIPLVSHISVWALALHTLLDFFIVLVPAIIAAGVALGAFAIAAQPAAQDVYNRFMGLHTALDALSTGDSSISQAAQHIGFLSDQVGTLNATMKPVPVTFRSLQSAMAPEVVTLYGAAINVLTSKTGLLGDIVQKTGTWIEDLVIKIQTAVSSHTGSLDEFISTATNDLHILGSIGGSLLSIFSQLLRAGEITHVSELLFEGIAYALSLVAKALNVVGPYATAAAIAFFAMVHYGGLLGSALVWVVNQGEFLSLWLVTLLSKLPLVGDAFGTLGTSMKAAFAAVPPVGILAIAAAIAAVGYAIYSAAQASSQAKSFVAGLQQALASDNASTGFAQIQTNLASIGIWLNAASQNQRNFVGNMAQGWSDLFKDASGFGLHLGVYKDLWEAITGTNQQPGSTALVLKEQTAEQKQWTTTLAAAADTTKQYGTTAAQSFALMDLAGVKVTDTLAVQKTKVDDLVTGWLNMGVQGYQLKSGMNQLGAAINAVTLSSDLQDSSITTLTGDFTSFLTLVTQGETSFETFGSGVSTVATNLKAAGAAMGGVNQASFTLRQSWEAQLTSGQSLYNNLLEQNAAAGNTAKTNSALAQSGRDLVSILLAQGGAGQESVQGTYALAQTMGYTGKATYDALEKWSGGNSDVTGTLQDLNKQVGFLETGSSNLNTDVLNLAAAVGTDLTQAIAAGLVAMPQLTKSVAGLYQYILTNRKAVEGGPTAQEISLSTSVANALIAVYGTTPQGLDQAKNEFLATLIQMGVQRSQALQLWAADTDKAANVLPSLTPLQNRLNNLETQFGKPITPMVDLTPLQSRLTEMQRDMGQAYNPPPGYLAQSDANQAKITHWFTTDLPRGASVGWSAVYNGFDNDVWHPIGNFFNKDLPSWYNSSNAVLLSGWQTFIRWWDGNISGPWDQFWNHTVPGWASAAGTFITGVWANVAHGFGQYLVSDVSKFFTAQLPSWLDSLGREWNSFWSQGWSDFDKSIVQPMERWFTTTMPNAIWGGLKGGLDKAIGGMNSVIGFINSVTGVVGVHIGTIPRLAGGGGVPMASGSVPGTGDEDGTHIIAMGGEYMLRKPARMALQAEYGPGFLDHLNNADAWLHSGSQGNAASQGRPSHGRYASGGGILGDIENWLGTAAGDVGSLAVGAWHGVASAAQEVAKYGEQAAFNAMWDVSGKPAEAGLEHLGTPGAMGAAWMQDVHNGVSNWISGKTTAAEAAGSARVGGAGGAVQALAQQMAAARGWTGALWADLNTVEMDEAGWNLHAVNPTSGAYGIAQFINGPSEYAQYGGNAGTAAGQVTAFLNYVSQRYGTPAGALAHEEAFHWYAVGGPVINAIKQATANRNERESMALGSYLLTEWNSADSKSLYDEYGAFLVNLRKHKGFTGKDALDPSKSASLMAPYYAKGINASTAARWKSRPDQAALYAAAIAQTDAGTRWSTPSATSMRNAWREVTDAFATPAEAQSSTINPRSIADWSKYAPKIHPEWQSAFENWNDLYKWTRRPKGTTAKAWDEWMAQRTTIAKAEAAANSALSPIFANINSPQQLNSGNWPTAESAVQRWDTALASARLAQQHHPDFYGGAVRDASALESDLKGAASAWGGIWGQYLVPGVKVRQPGEQTVSVNLDSLITGFPFGSGGSGGGDYGFGLAAGGAVPGLAEMASMFAPGMAAGGTVPDFFVPGMSASLQKQLQAQSVGELPRTLSDAAGAKGGLHVGQLTINNPRPASTEDSITRTSNRLAFLGGRGIL